MQVSEQLEAALSAFGTDADEHGFVLEHAVEIAIPEIKAMEARLERLETALESARADFEHLVQMVMANDPKRINNGTVHRQNGIIAEAVAIGSMGASKARAALAGQPSEGETDG